MILTARIKNYRSYREDVTFSLIPNNSDFKSENIAEIHGPNNQIFKVLKTALIYGANASGKSNILRGIYEIIYLVLNKPKVEDDLRIYKPFEFDLESNKNPSEFEIVFIGPNSIKYEYRFEVLGKVILAEELNYYPNGRITQLFVRDTYDPNSRTQKGRLGDSLGKKEITTFSNQLILSKFGDDEPHELLTEVYLQFKNYSIINATNQKHTEDIKNKISTIIYENKNLLNKLGKLINLADTKIEDIKIIKQLFGDEDSDSEKRKSNSTITFDIYAKHSVYNNDSVVDEKFMHLREESMGTKILYTLGGVILDTLEKGGTLIVDELDTSLHPFVTKLLVLLFQSKVVNNKNAQLIFTTHDVTLLDRDLIRRDQIWIAEKAKTGTSELYSLQDFEGLREETPFDKWYLAGKFGGLPVIKSIESVFDTHD